MIQMYISMFAKNENSCWPDQHYFLFLAHLSRRLIGELLVYRGIRRPSVRRQHFQTTSSLKPLGRFFSYFIYSIYTVSNRYTGKEVVTRE